MEAVRILNMRDENSNFYPPEHWLKLAQEAREKAQALKEPHAKDEMERVALLYERLAEFVGRRSKET